MMLPRWSEIDCIIRSCFRPICAEDSSPTLERTSGVGCGLLHCDAHDRVVATCGRVSGMGLPQCDRSLIDGEAF